MWDFQKHSEKCSVLVYEERSHKAPTTHTQFLCQNNSRVFLASSYFLVILNTFTSASLDVVDTGGYSHFNGNKFTSSTSSATQRQFIT